MSTFAETVEQLKNQYTDKYVKVDPSRPELARFRNVVGQVKTVNMNGRALVQFLDYHQNIGWHDIDLSCLTVVDAPPADVAEKAEPKRAHDKPAGKAAPTTGAKQVADAKATAAAGEKKLSPLEMARLQGAGGKHGSAAPAAKPPAGEKKSTADILAAARGGAASKAAAQPLDAAAQRAAGAAPSATPAKPAGGKPSTADILAAARGKAAALAAASTPAAPASTAPAPKLPAAEAAAEPAPAPAAVAPASPKASASGAVKLDKSTMTIDEMLAYCRQKDAE